MILEVYAALNMADLKKLLIYRYNPDSISFTKDLTTVYVRPELYNMAVNSYPRPRRNAQSNQGGNMEYNNLSSY